MAMGSACESRAFEQSRVSCVLCYAKSLNPAMVVCGSSTINAHAFSAGKKDFKQLRHTHLTIS